MSRRANPAVVGAFVLGGVAIAVAALIALGGGNLLAETQRYSIFFEGSVNGLVVGSPVKIQGVPVGQVMSIRAIVTEDDDGIFVTLTETVIEIDLARFDQTRREQERPAGAGDDGIDSGVRAQLNLQSLLTGQLFVALTIDAESDGFVGPEELARHQQVPSIPTTIDKIEANLRQTMERLRALPLEEVVGHADEALVAIRDLARDPALTSAASELEKTLRETRQLVARVDGQVDPISEEAIAALEELQSTLVAVRGTLDPGSPLVFQVGTTLQEISQAAQAMRALANTLERQPNALVFGKSGASE